MKANVDCLCAHCRVTAAGLGPGPYTPAEFAKIALPIVTTAPNPQSVAIANDPDVQAAVEARELARLAYDHAERLWLEAATATRRAELDAHAEAYAYRPQRGGDMSRTTVDYSAREAAQRVENERKFERDVAWERVVRAQQAEATAQLRARLRWTEENTPKAPPEAPEPRRSPSFYV